MTHHGIAIHGHIGVAIYATQQFMVTCSGSSTFAAAIHVTGVDFIVKTAVCHITFPEVQPSTNGTTANNNECIAINSCLISTTEDIAFCPTGNHVHSGIAGHFGGINILFDTQAGAEDVACNHGLVMQHIHFSVAVHNSQ